MTRANHLNELAEILSVAIVKARHLHLATSAYILAMALVEVSQALKVASDNDNDGLNADEEGCDH